MRPFVEKTYQFMYLLSIFGQILVDVMIIFQDGAFPNLEYHLIQVIWCVSALIRYSYHDK